MCSLMLSPRVTCRYGGPLGSWIALLRKLPLPDPGWDTTRSLAQPYPNPFKMPIPLPRPAFAEPLQS